MGVIRSASLSGRDVMGFLRCASVTPTAVSGGPPPFMAGSFR